MKLWRARVVTQPGTVTRVLWETSESKLRQLVRNSYPGHSWEQLPIEVPTTRQELADWLNTYTNP